MLYVKILFELSLCLFLHVYINYMYLSVIVTVGSEGSLSSLGQDNGGGSGRFKQGIGCIKLFFSCHAWKGSLFTVELVSRFLLHNSVF